MSSPHEVSDPYALDPSNVGRPTTTRPVSAKPLKRPGPGFIQRRVILISGLVEIPVQHFIKLD